MSSPAVVRAYRRQYREFLYTMQDAGYLEATSSFRNLQYLQERLNQPGVIEGILQTFFTNMEKGLNNLRTHIDNGMRDQESIFQVITRVRGSSTSVGARKVVLACDEMGEANLKKDIARLRRAMIWLNQEYCSIRSKFLTLIEFEQMAYGRRNDVPAVPTEPMDIDEWGI